MIFLIDDRMVRMVLIPRIELGFDRYQWFASINFKPITVNCGKILGNYVNGAVGGNRNLDLLLTKQVLYH